MATEQYYATGRRKEAVARVYLRKGNGKFLVNGRDLKTYFPREVHQIIIKQPLKITDLLVQFDIKANLCGGGASGQAGALRHGIARALLKVNAELRPQLKREGFLTRDPRMKERKKYGRKRARRRFQYSKR